MKLEQAIQQILKQKGEPMTVAELADAINAQQLCTRHDGSAVCDFQVHGRSFNRQSACATTNPPAMSTNPTNPNPKNENDNFYR